MLEELSPSLIWVARFVMAVGASLVEELATNGDPWVGTSAALGHLGRIHLDSACVVAHFGGAGEITGLSDARVSGEEGNGHGCGCACDIQRVALRCYHQRAGIASDGLGCIARGSGSRGNSAKEGAPTCVGCYGLSCCGLSGSFRHDFRIFGSLSCQWFWGGGANSYPNYFVTVKAKH